MLSSKRLLEIASLVDKNKKVFDVGCDHGLLSIHLSDTNLVVATDINEYSVNLAKENIKKQNKDIEVIKTDGLNNLDIKKDDIIIISGMGTKTIIKILNNNLDKLSDTLIIQSNNDYDILRKKVVLLGYKIENEKYIVDKNKNYIIIKFIKGHTNYDKYDYIIGPILRHDKNYLLYLDNLIDRTLSNIPKNCLDKINYYLDLKKTIKNELVKVIN